MAVFALIGMCVHLWLRIGNPPSTAWANAPLLVVLLAGGLPLVAVLVWRGLHGEFGADHLAGVSIVASVLLDE